MPDATPAALAKGTDATLARQGNSGPPNRRRIVRAGSGALLAQWVSSAGNLLAGVAVVRLLGLEALGRFSLLFSALLTIVAMQTSWVGDSLTVLDRQRPEFKRGIDTSQWAFTVVGAFAGGALAALAGITGPAAVAFTLLVAAWQLEEYGRRVFMARLEFGRLATNDATYLVITGILLLCMHLSHARSLAMVFLCMTAGAGAAFLSAMLLLPHADRLTLRRLSTADASRVARFGVWRAAQSGLGIFGGFMVRVIVASLGSAVILGQVELGRLVVAPIFTLVAASSNVLLPLLSRRRQDRLGTMRVARLSAAGLVVVTMSYGVIALLLAAPFGRVIAGPGVEVERAIVAAWLLQALVIGATNPFFTAIVVSGRVAFVFWVKAFGVVLSTATAWAVMRTSMPQLVPVALAIGPAASVVLLRTRSNVGTYEQGGSSSLVRV